MVIIMKRYYEVIIIIYNCLLVSISLVFGVVTDTWYRDRIQGSAHIAELPSDQCLTFNRILA
jgi:hypothetical protein